MDIDHLLTRLTHDDPTALAELFDACHATVFRLAFRVTGDGNLADEATVAAMERLWRHRHRWRGQCSGMTWVYRVATTAALDGRRGWIKWMRRRHRQSSAGVEVIEAGNPSSTAEEAEEQGRMQRKVADAIRRLSTADRALVHWFYYEQLTVRQIADVLQISEGAVKMRLSRCRHRLRAIFGSDSSKE